MTRALVLLLWLLAPSVTLAQVPDSAFQPAWGAPGLQYLAAPTQIPWKDLAFAALPSWNPSHPDTFMLRANYDELFGGVLITFDSPLGGLVPLDHYYVLGDSGVVEVAPAFFRGTIEVRTDPPMWTIHVIAYSGVIVAHQLTPASPLGRPAFSFSSRAPLRMESYLAMVGGTPAQPRVFVSRGAGGMVLAFDSTKASLRNPGWGRSLRSTPTSARLFGFPGTGQWYLLVRWDGEACFGAFMLYDLTTALPRYVVENPGECDE